MSSAYWDQWDRSEIDFMHGIEPEHNLDCVLEDVNIRDEDEEVFEMFKYRGSAYAYMVD